MFDDLLARARGCLRRIFILPLWLTPLIAGPSFFLLVWTLTHPSAQIVSFLVYHLSVYALAISVIWTMRVVPRVRRRLDWLEAFRHTPLGELLADRDFRAWAAVALTMVWNLTYALAKLLVGLALGSAWLRTMGVYTLVLAWLRFTLVRPSLKYDGATLAWRRYRACGVVLLAMNAALIFVVVRAVGGGGSRYPGPLIYLMAVYAFWALSSATVKLVRSHRRADPLRSAARAVSLTAAMVSMLSLEIALIDRFGDGSPVFRGIMISFSGSAVCVAELGMALYMIHRGNQQLLRYEDNDIASDGE